MSFRITTVAYCRTFVGIDKSIQDAVIASWRGATSGFPDVHSQIFLVGDTTINKAASRNYVGYLDTADGVQYDELYNTPYLQSVLKAVDQVALGDWILVVEPDVTLPAGLLLLIDTIERLKIPKPLLVGNHHCIQVNYSNNPLFTFDTSRAIAAPGYDLTYMMFRKGFFPLAHVPYFMMNEGHYVGHCVIEGLRNWGMNPIDCTSTLPAARLVQNNAQMVRLHSQPYLYNRMLATQDAAHIIAARHVCPYVFNSTYKLETNPYARPNPENTGDDNFAYYNRGRGHTTKENAFKSFQSADRTDDSDPEPDVTAS